MRDFLSFDRVIAHSWKSENPDAQPMVQACAGFPQRSAAGIGFPKIQFILAGLAGAGIDASGDARDFGKEGAYCRLCRRVGLLFGASQLAVMDSHSVRCSEGALCGKRGDGSLHHGLVLDLLATVARSQK